MCGSKKPAVTTTSTAPPPEVMAAYRRLLERAEPLADTPYQEYTGDRIADFTPDQLQAFQGVRDAQGLARPYIDQATQYATMGADPISGAAIANYQNPYQQQVIDATMADFNAQNARQLSEVRGNAAARGALGGNRVAVAEALASEQQNRTQAPILANLRSQGWQSALGAAQADRNAAAQAAYTFGNLGNQSLSTSLTGANALYGMGSQQQALDQAGLNVPYEYFQERRAYPFQTTSWLSGITSGLGSQMGGTSTTQQPAPSLWNSILGGVATLGGGYLASGGRFGFASGGVVSNGLTEGGGGGVMPYSRGYIPMMPIARGPGAPRGSAPAPVQSDNAAGNALQNLASMYRRRPQGDVGLGSWDAEVIPAMPEMNRGGVVPRGYDEGGVVSPSQIFFMPPQDQQEGMFDYNSPHGFPDGRGNPVPQIPPHMMQGATAAISGGRPAPAPAPAGFGGAPPLDFAPNMGTLGEPMQLVGGQGAISGDDAMPGEGGRLIGGTAHGFAPGPAIVKRQLGPQSFVAPAGLAPPSPAGVVPPPQQQPIARPRTVATPPPGFTFDSGLGSGGSGVVGGSGGGTQAPPAAQSNDPTMRNVGLALMMAGLRTMASRSPWAGVAIGEGGQAGVQTYMQADQQHRQNTFTQQQIDLRARQLAQQARHQSAQLAEQSRHHRATEGVGRYQLFPGENGQGVNYVNTRDPRDHGTLPINMGARPGSSESRRMAEAQFLITRGVAPDMATAWSMVTQGVNTGMTQQRLIQAEGRAIRGDIDAGRRPRLTPEQIEAEARRIILQRIQANPDIYHGPGGPPPAANPPPAAGNTNNQQGQQGSVLGDIWRGLTQGSGAVAPDPSPQPATASNPPIPQALRQVHAAGNLRWNEASRRYRDMATGRIYDEQGRPVNAP